MQRPAATRADASESMLESRSLQTQYAPPADEQTGRQPRAGRVAPGKCLTDFEFTSRGGVKEFPYAAFECSAIAQGCPTSDRSAVAAREAASTHAHVASPIAAHAPHQCALRHDRRRVHDEARNRTRTDRPKGRSDQMHG